MGFAILLLVLCFVVAIAAFYKASHVADELSELNKRIKLLTRGMHEKKKEKTKEKRDEIGQKKSDEALAAELVLENDAEGASSTESEMERILHAVKQKTEGVTHARHEESVEEKIAPSASIQASESGTSLQETSKITLEQLIAEKWLAMLGAVALLFGIGFFLKYLIDHGYLGPAVRVTIGVIAGVIAYMGGLWAMRKGHVYFAQALAGTALGFWLISFFASYQWYHLLSQSTALFGMVLGIAAMLGFALYYNAQAVSILGLIGGFLAPLLLNSGKDQQWAYFSYIFLLDLAVLVCAAFRKWRITDLVAFGGTLLMWLLWMSEHYHPTKLHDTVTILCGFFFLFSWLGVAHHLIWRRASVASDYAIILLTPFCFFTLLYFLSHDVWKDWHGAMAAGMAGYYLLFWVMARIRTPLDKTLRECYMGLAVGFFILAVPLQFSGHVVLLVWSIQAVLILALGFRLASFPMRTSGVSLIFIVCLYLTNYVFRTVAQPDRFNGNLLYHLDTAAEPMPMIWNVRMVSLLAAALACSAMSWIYSRERVRSTLTLPFENGTEDGLRILCALLLTAAVMVETFVYSHRQRWNPNELAAAMAVEWALAVWITSMACYFLKSMGLRITAIFMFIPYVLIQFSGVADCINNAEEFAGRAYFWQWPLINPWGCDFLAGLLALGTLPHLVQREKRKQQAVKSDQGSLHDLCHTCGILWFILLTTYITCEAYVQSTLHHWFIDSNLIVTLIWTLLASLYLILGIFSRQQGLRIIALLLFLLTALKVFLFDIWKLSVVVRYIAFTALGIALLFTSYLYSRYRNKIGDWITLRGEGDPKPDGEKEIT